MTLKSGLEITQGHSNRYHSEACVRFPIRLLSHSYKAGSNSSTVLHIFFDYLHLELWFSFGLWFQYIPSWQRDGV